MVSRRKINDPRPVAIIPVILFLGGISFFNGAFKAKGSDCLARSLSPNKYLNTCGFSIGLLLVSFLKGPVF